MEPIKLDQEEKVMNLKDYDVVIIDDTAFEVSEMYDKKIYLTTLDSRVNEYNLAYKRRKHDCIEPMYHNYVIHLREKNTQRAVLTKSELWNLLETQNYYIG